MKIEEVDLHLEAINIKARTKHMCKTMEDDLGKKFKYTEIGLRRLKLQEKQYQDKSQSHHAT